MHKQFNSTDRKFLRHTTHKLHRPQPVWGSLTPNHTVTMNIVVQLVGALCTLFFSSLSCSSSSAEEEVKAHTRSGRQTGRQTDRQTDRQADRQTDRQVDRPLDR